MLSNVLSSVSVRLSATSLMLLLCFGERSCNNELICVCSKKIVHLIALLVKHC